LYVEILKKFIKFYKYNVKTFEINKLNYNLILIININLRDKKDNKIANKIDFIKFEI